MKNPPDFVLYVVMYKPESKFVPYCEGYWTGLHAMGYLHKIDANRRLKDLRQTWGKGNVYVQQYGPYK
jgi:hypothetical protein